MPSAIALRPMGFTNRPAHPKGRRKVLRPANDSGLVALAPASFDFDPDDFYGSSDREVVAPGIEVRIACDNAPRRSILDDDQHPMHVECFRTRGVE